MSPCRVTVRRTAISRSNHDAGQPGRRTYLRFARWPDRRLRSKDQPAGRASAIVAVVIVRTRTDQELDACHQPARLVHEVDDYPPRQPEDLVRFIAAPAAIGAWVADEEGSVVGHVALHPDSSAAVMDLACRLTQQRQERLALVARLLVAPDHRRRGIGRALLDAAAQQALACGRWPIVDVAAHFEGAIKLYEGAGWIPAGKVSVHIRYAEPLDEVVFIGPSPT